MNRHLHILGICGTFMGGLAVLARELGWRVTGNDANVYPPMSDQLRGQGIELVEGWDPEQVPGEPDLYLIGNALSRGNPLVEHILEKDLPFASGPAWLHDQVLRDKHVLAVAGTHGKTTTSGLLAWILDQAGLEPGFLIGGLPGNFTTSARLGGGRYFVIEADEYDSAFFDKRAKFVHYRPRTVILNNLEFDHADIYADLEAIIRQFHHLVRIVPKSGLLVVNRHEENLQSLLEMGCWSRVQGFAGDQNAAAQTLETPWRVASLDTAGHTELQISHPAVAGQPTGTLPVATGLLGTFNALNTLAAIAAAADVGISPEIAARAVARFRNARRRLEVIFQKGGITIYDDFAHHPTAIRVTLEALRRRTGHGRIIALVDIRSRTMRQGSHSEQLPAALSSADQVILHTAEKLAWDPSALLNNELTPTRLLRDVDAIVSTVAEEARDGDHIVIMSNGAFSGIHQRLTTAIEARQSLQ